MTTKRGCCGEYAILFCGIANSIGIKSRVVYNTAEDHMWDEVLINGTWTHFEIGANQNLGFNNPDFYERIEPEGWGKQLSYVYVLDDNGNEQDITSKYTDTGRLTVQVVKDGCPIENAKVTIESRFLMESPKFQVNYNQPRFVLEKITDSNGFCNFDVGGNNYTIIVEVKQILGFTTQTIVEVKENTTTTVELNPNQLSIWSVTDLIATTIVTPFLILCVFFYLKRHNPLFKEQSNTLLND